MVAKETSFSIDPSLPGILYGREVTLLEARVLTAVINAFKSNPQITWEETVAMKESQKVPLFHLRYAYTTGLRQTSE